MLYTGADERTGAARPPAVPVGELLDALDGAATAADGRPVREHVVVRHPLQVVDERNFTAGALGRPGPVQLRRRRPPRRRWPAAAAARRPPRRSCPAPLPAGAAPDRGRPRRPGRAPSSTRSSGSCGSGCRCRCAGETRTSRTGCRCELDGRWSRGRSATGCSPRALAGVDPAPAVGGRVAPRRRCRPRELGRATLIEVADRVEPDRRGGRAATRPAPARVVDVRARDLPGGSVRHRHGPRRARRRGAARRLLPAGRQAPAARLGPAARAGRRRPGPRPGAPSPSAAPPGERPSATASRPCAPPTRRGRAAWLDELVALRDRALREPLPLPVDTALRLRAAAGPPATPRRRPSRTPTASWQGGFEAHRRAPRAGLGRGAPLDDLLGTADRGRAGLVAGGRARRLGVLARRVWEPLLDPRASRSSDHDASRSTGSTSRPCSTSAATCPRAPRCWRPAPAPARRSPSRPSPPGTSPRASPSSPSCCSSPSAAPRPPSCATGCASAWSRPSAALRDPGRPRQRTTTCVRHLAAVDDAELGRRRRRLTRALAELRRRHHRHHPRLLPADARRPRRRPATSTPTPSSSRTSPTWSTRSSTTSTSQRYAAGAGAGADRRRRPRRSPGPRSATRRPRLEPADAAGRLPGRAPLRASPAPSPRRCAAASGPAACSTTTTCSCCCATRSADPRTGAGRRRAGPRRATGWCWSTSSRTPTRCSGRSCAPPSTGTARWS